MHKRICHLKVKFLNINMQKDLACITYSNKVTEDVMCRSSDDRCVFK